MSKKNDQKRKAQLAQKAVKESFAFQVKFAKETAMPKLSADDDRLQTEIDTICAKDLNVAMLTLGKLMSDIKKELGIVPEEGMNSLDGTLVPYILGATEVNPLETSATTELFMDADAIELPLQVKIVYDNEVRNKVIDWLKAHDETVTTIIGVPVLKLPNIVIEINRHVKE